MEEKPIRTIVWRDPATAREVRKEWPLLLLSEPLLEPSIARLNWTPLGKEAWMIEFTGSASLGTGQSRDGHRRDDKRGDTQEFFSRVISPSKP